MYLHVCTYVLMCIYVCIVRPTAELTHYNDNTPVVRTSVGLSWFHIAVIIVAFEVSTNASFHELNRQFATHGNFTRVHYCLCTCGIESRDTCVGYTWNFCRGADRQISYLNLSSAERLSDTPVFS